jgi:exonuclease VII large subunit
MPLKPNSRNEYREAGTGSEGTPSRGRDPAEQLAGLSEPHRFGGGEKTRILRSKLDSLHADLVRVLKKRVENSGHRLDRSIINLDALSPLKVLSRGYSISQDEESGKILTSIHETNRTSHPIQLADGHVLCTADRIMEENSMTLRGNCRIVVRRGHEAIGSGCS